MKYAYVHKNFRRLQVEEKIILFAHLLTCVFCFIPWYEGGQYSSTEDFYLGITGPTFLMGWFVFLLSFIVVVMMIDRLFEKNKIQLPFSEVYFYGVIGIESLITIFLMWSVLSSPFVGFSNDRVTFGLFVPLVAQVTGLVACFLLHQMDKTQKVKDFFQHPNVK